MAGREETRRALYQRANGQCECTLSSCSHHMPGSRCSHGLNPGEWKDLRRVSGGNDDLSNLMAMCPPCNRNAINAQALLLKGINEKSLLKHPVDDIVLIIGILLFVIGSSLVGFKKARDLNHGTAETPVVHHEKPAPA